MALLRKLLGLGREPPLGCLSNAELDRLLSSEQKEPKSGA